jgi:hypothetical protein
MNKAIWEKAFEVSIGNCKGYKKRLNELLTWDKPLVSKSKDTNGKWREWANKCSALQILIKNKSSHL